MRIKNEVVAYVDEQGRLIIPPEVGAQYGLSEGSTVVLNLEKNDISVYRPITHLAKVYIEPTSSCNLSCRTCIRNIWDEPLGMMSEETFERILAGLQALKNKPTVFFGGFGEPLSHPRMIDMLARVKNIGCRAELITNGTLLNNKRSRQLLDAGIDMLWVSLDGATPDSYENVRQGAALPDVIQNLSSFAALRPTHAYFFPQPEIGIVFVAMKQNFEEITSLIQNSKLLGAAHFLMTNVLPYTEEMRSQVLYPQAMNEIDVRASPVGPHITLPRIDIDDQTLPPLLRMVHTGYHLNINDSPLSATKDRCPFIASGSTAIAWDGNLSPCLALVHNHYSYLGKFKRALRRYVVGNIREHDLPDLWNQPDYIQFRERVQRFDFPPCTACGGCEMIPGNLEDCYGNPFPTCGGCLWAQGIVQCP